MTAPKKTRKPSRLPETRTQGDAPKLRTPGIAGSLELEYREGVGYLWPDGVDRPGRWHVRTPIPCPECNLVRMADTRQAVMCIGTPQGGGIAYLRCRSCEHKFQLPVTLV